MTCMYANFLETCVTCNCWIVPWWLIVISYITCMLHKLTWSLNLWCTRSRVMIHMNIACAALACANTLGLVRFRGIQSGRNNKCMKKIMIWTRIYSRSKINLPIMIGRTRDRRAGLVHTSWLVDWFRAFWCTYYEQINFRPGINLDIL
jgi:hypothetical protein